MSSKAETLASINQDLQAQLDHIEDTDSHVRTIKLLTMKLEEATQQSAQLRLNCADVEVLRRHLQKISDELIQRKEEIALLYNKLRVERQSNHEL